MSAQEAHNATEWGNVAKVFQGNRTATDDYSEEAIKISGMEARKSEPITVFDNGCGGGGTAIIAARLFPNAKVIAGDFAPAMIVATNNRIQQEGLTNITAEVQDGVNLTLESNQFDYVFCQFTVMFFPNYDKGFSEMYRVTKEGGTCVILTWRESEQMKIIEEARRRVVGNIIEHQTQGHVNFFEKENLLIEYAKNAGFKTAEVTQSAQVWWFSVEFFDNFTTNPAVLQLGSDLTEEQMEQYKQEIKNIARERATEKGIKLDVVANILKATK